jgi:hypothetical protein
MVASNFISPWSVSVRMGDGTGGFGPRTDYPTGVNPTSVSIGDLNGDGRPDLAVSNLNTSGVSVLLALEATSLGLASNPNPVTAGTPITLTATASPVAPITGTPTGMVQFFDGTTLLGSAPLVPGSATLSSGATLTTAIATLSSSIGAVGDHRLAAVFGGSATLLGRISVPVAQRVTSSVGVNEPLAPDAVSLAPPHPNPARAVVLIRFGLATPAHVSVRIYDLGGRMVKSLSEGSWAAGDHSLQWDTHGRNDQRVAGGIYFVRLAVNDKVKTARFVVLS